MSSINSNNISIQNVRNDTDYIPLTNIPEQYQIIDYYIDKKKSIPNYIQRPNRDQLSNQSSNQSSISTFENIDTSYYKNNRAIYFLGSNFDWFIDKKNKVDKFMREIPFYFHSSSIRKRTFNQRRKMLHYMYDILFLNYSDHFIIYLSDNSDINIMTIAYYLCTNVKNCIFIFENINPNVFTHLKYEYQNLRNILYQKAKKNKYCIFHSKNEFFNHFIDPFTNRFNIDLLKKLFRDNETIIENIYEDIANKFSKLDDPTLKYSMNLLNTDNNSRFLTYPNPVDITNYHKHSVLTKHMKDKVSIDSIFHTIYNENYIRAYYYKNKLHNKQSNELTRNENRIKRKYDIFYQQIVPNIKYLDTKSYLQHNILYPFTRYILNKKKLSEKYKKNYYIRSSNNPLIFIAKYCNPYHPIQKEMLINIRQITNRFGTNLKRNKIDESNFDLLFQKIIISHLFNELNESRFFIKTMYQIQNIVNNKFYSEQGMNISNYFIALLGYFDTHLVSLENDKQNGNNLYRLYFNKISQYFDSTENIAPKFNKDMSYTFVSSNPSDWVFEFLNYYYENFNETNIYK